MPILRMALANGHPMVSALVGVSGPNMAAMCDEGLTAPDPIRINLLIDTGASATCIDPDVLSSLDLTPTGVMEIHTPSTDGTAHPCLQYDVSLLAPAQCGEPHLIDALQIIGARMNDPMIDGLLGRDILDKCIFVYDGPDQSFTLSFLPLGPTLECLNTPPSASAPRA